MKLSASLFVVLIFSCIMLSTADARLYRWVDANGNVYYSDKVPPQNVKGEHDVIDDSGNTIQTIEREKTRAELEELEVERQKQAELQKVIDARKQNDDRLLKTYTKVEDIQRVSENRVSTVKSRIFNSGLKLDQLRQQIAAQEKNKQRFIDSDREVPEGIINNIESLDEQAFQVQLGIRSDEELIETLKQQSLIDQARFLELRGETK